MVDISKVERLSLSYWTSVVWRNRWCSTIPYSWCNEALNKTVSHHQKYYEYFDNFDLRINPGAIDVSMLNELL